MNKKRIMIASVVVWIVGIIYGMITCGWLFKWVYALPPNIWKAPEAIMATGNMILSNLLGLLIAIIFVTVFALLYKGIPGTGVQKGMAYGFIIWLVSAFSGIIMMPFYMTISTTVVVYWILQSLVITVIDGAIIGAIYTVKKKK